MSFQIREPVLIIGLGGLGSKLALGAKESLDAECLLISNDQRDFPANYNAIKISTGPVVNPSVQMIRGSAYSAYEEIKEKVSKCATVILMANLAGKVGSAVSPIVSRICRDSDIGLMSFVIMPFRYEKDRIFNSGIALKRVKEDSQCTIVLDNDSLLESNPDLNPKQCFEIGNSAIMHVVKELDTSEVSSDTNILTTSKSHDIEESLRDSLKMLYNEAPPNSVKRSMLYVAGGENIPLRILNSIASLTKNVSNEEPHVGIISGASEESRVIMLSSVQGMTKFDKYDPLGDIPHENTLDWNEPDCSINCGLDEIYQLE